MKDLLSYFDNTFDLQVKLNCRNRFKVFSPLVRNVNIKNIAISIIFPFLVPFIVFMLPLFRSINFHGNGENVFFVSSKKSMKILNTELAVDELNIVSILNEKTEKVSLKIYLKSICYSVRFLKKYRSNYWFWPAVLGLYDLIMLKDYLIEKAPNKVLFTNHYDRWASLFIDYCSTNNASSVMYQHGVEDETSYFPVAKIGNVDELYCYDSSQAKVFKKHVYEQVLKVCYFTPKLLLNKLDESDYSKHVLIICHGTLDKVSDEIELAMHLSKKFDRVYLKPHPSIKKENYNLSFNEKVSVIQDDDFFPYVAEVYHSGSTLALEYENTLNSVKVKSLDDYVGS